MSRKKASSEDKGTWEVLQGVVDLLSRRLADAVETMPPDYTARELRDMVACCKALSDLSLCRFENSHIEISFAPDVEALAL